MYHSADLFLQNSGLQVSDDLPFNQFDSYQNIPAEGAIFDMTPFDDNSQIYFTGFGEFTDLDAQAVTLFASGYQSSDIPELELWVAQTDGTTWPLTPYLNQSNVLGGESSIRCWPNPATDLLSLQFELQRSDDVMLRIRSVSGGLVAQRMLGLMTSGKQLVTEQVGNLKPGMYILELLSSEAVQSVPFSVVR